MQASADAGSVNGPTEGNVLSSARSIAIVATIVACACALVAIPVAAFGDDSPTTPAAPVVSEELLEARADVAEANEVAVEDAPPAVGNSCGRTLDVAGIGSTCVTPDDLLRVELQDGSSATIHGLDAPPIGLDAFAPGSQAKVNAAGPSDIACGADGTRRYVLVYARPADVTSRFDAVAPKLREEAYKMSAFLDSESQAVDPRKGKRLPFRCEGAAPTVLHATLPPKLGGGVDFEYVWGGLRALGYDYNSFSSNERYIVYVDAASAAGAAGTAHVFPNDSRPGTENSNNKGGMYAIEYRWEATGAPHWDVLMHEVSHTMGAVVNTAPNTSGGGHCNDGQDVMCYADGGPNSAFSTSTCAQKVLDCGRNDYFNPSPAAGSFLATNWNMASAANLWLQHRAAGDQVAPTAPPSISQTGASNAAVGISWLPGSDDVAVSGYIVRVRDIGGGWRDVATVDRTAASIAGLAATTSYEVGVAARDAAGNVSP
ncbi:MAG: glycosyl hydrolase, partial [Thermoleophilia bacterium]|nr:glycosyl hydrolase [Thermoleophilia bacterium]